MNDAVQYRQPLPYVTEIEKIAKVCHEVNRALCLTQGDTSQAPWDEAPENIKASALAGVRAARDSPDATPESMHMSWCDFKIKDGWVWGPEKNAELKTHPCLKPYEQLPENQRVKDHLFLAVVRAMS